MKAKVCAISLVIIAAIIAFLIWLYWHPYAFNDPIRVSGKVIVADTDAPASDSIITFREFGWRGIPIPHSSSSLADRRTFDVLADVNGEFKTNFQDDWLEVISIKVGGKVMPDFDALFTNRNSKNASLDRTSFRLDRAAYSEDPEVIFTVYSQARPIPEKKWKWIHEFIPGDQIKP